MRSSYGRRVLVTGGRDLTDRALVWSALDEEHHRDPIRLLIHGAARGADALAEEWAQSRGVEVKRFPADWARLGKRAGPLRNLDMLAEHPNLVLGFPGGAGTAHCLAAARRAGLRIRTVQSPSATPA